MPSGPKSRKAARKKKQSKLISRSSPTIPEHHKLDSVIQARGTGSSPITMEEEPANQRKEEFRVEDEIVREVGVDDNENSESVKEIIVKDDSNSRSSSSSDEEDESKHGEPAPEAVEQEKIDEEKAIPDSFAASVDPVVPPPQDFLQPDENLDRPELESEKAEFLSDSSNVISAAVANVESKVMEETKEAKLPAAEDENATKETPLESQIHETRACEVVAEEHENESQIPESTGYKPIISLTPAIVQPTSWKSCCGLLDILRRRSDR